MEDAKVNHWKCPYCNDNAGQRWRDPSGDVYHLLGNGATVPCYERDRGTDAEKREELRNELQADRYAGREQ